jgi:hypothetical protein
VDRNGRNVDSRYVVDADRGRRRDVGDTGGKVGKPTAIKDMVGGKGADAAGGAIDAERECILNACRLIPD